jgi:hypothetical protein
MGNEIEEMEVGGAMSGVRRGLALVSVLLAVMAAWTMGALGQATTTVQDTVYLADGSTAAGTVLVSWSGFTTAVGQVIAAGTTSATLGAGGVLTIALVPNADVTPTGSYYTAVFHLSDGTTSRQYWVIPAVAAGGAPVKLAAIENQVLPQSVAMQTVSKSYVDNAIAQAQSGFPTGSTTYVPTTGGTMTGPLVLPGDPVSSSQAADKNYVDNNVASIASGLGGKVSTLPAGTQVVGQPAGTQLEVNHLNGELYASQYVNGVGNNGIANALASTDCTSGCRVKVEPSYGGTDQVNAASVASNGAVVDARGGSEAVTVVNPLGIGTSLSAGESLAQVDTLSSPEMEALRPGAFGIGAEALTLSTEAAAGGSDQFPQNVEKVPYGKTTYGVLSLTGNYNTQGQHVQLNNIVNCYSVGDCLAGGQFITSSGGYRDNSDEGTHPYDLQVSEDSRVFEGDGRFLIDLNPAKTISTGYVSAGGKTVEAYASFTGTSFPLSVFLETSQAATSQPANLAPGTVTLAIATSGVTAGFATSTGGLAASGVACVADPLGGTFETANYSVVDATHVKLTLNKVHAVGSVIAVGGLCGYGLEQKVDTMNGIRQVFPILGAFDATDVYYVDGGGTTVVGRQGNGSTSAYLNLSLGIASISRSGNVVTVTTASTLPEDVNGVTLTVSGVADSSYNGSFAVATTGANTLTYANTGANSTSSGGTVADVTGSYAMYPMAEVLSVANPGNRQIDGTFLLAANTVAWAAGDAIEEPHFYQQYVNLDTELDTQYVPRPIEYTQAGKLYQGNVGPGLRGWQVTNAVPATSYLGGGGTHTAPDDAYVVSGPWQNDFEVDAGLQSVIYAHCNLHGCNRWDSGYNLFMMDTPTSRDALSYQPQSSTATWYLSGVPYSFSPAAFSAGTINVGTLNATTINGGISAASINSGTINAARLPLFGASGTTHAAGAVPDPGATSGATRFLREDGTWNVPSGGSSGGAAGGDLSGNYPNPTVAAVHATSGTVDGVTIGATTPRPGNFTTGSFTAPTTINTGAIAENGSLSLISTNLLTSPLLVQGGEATVNIFKDATPTKASSFGFSVPGSGVVGNDFQFSTYNGTAWAGRMTIVNATGNVGIGATNPASLLSVGSASQFQVDSAGDIAAAANGTFSGTVASAQYLGPLTAPSGSCPTAGAWVFSQDGHATFCASGTWVTKI